MSEKFRLQIMGKRKLFLLNESAVGYTIFKVSEAEEIAVKECDKTFAEFDRFSKTCQWVGILPFSSQEQALEEMQSVAKGKKSLSKNTEKKKLPLQSIVW